MSGLRETTWRDWLVALLLFCGSFSALAVAQKDQGVMRDEGTYFDAAERYWGWFEELGDNIATGSIGKSFQSANLQRHWSFNNEHPVLIKVLFAFSWRFLHRCECTTRATGLHSRRYKAPHNTLGLMSEISAFRMPAWFLTALAVAFIFLFGVRVESRLAGLAAALLYITMPRTFFHGQLACFDSAITTFWILVVYSYLYALDRARWGIVTALLFGLALATKHNAWFIPFLLLIHYLVVVWSDLSLRPLRLPRIPLVFVAMAILGPLVFWAHWPWLWFEPVKHLSNYFGFHLHHSFYNMEYLGKNWGLPPLPIGFPFGMTLFTAPTTLLVLMFGGLLVYARKPLNAVVVRLRKLRPAPYDDPFRYPAKRSWLRPGKGLNPRLGTLFALNAIFPLLLIALPSTPIFGGTKHFMPAYPFFALLAGVALNRLWSAFSSVVFLGHWRTAVLGTALAVLVALPGALNTLFTHPFGLSQYNALAGGPAGGADLGLNRQFWGYAPRQLLPWINESFPKRANVYFHDLNHSSYGAYLRDGLLREDIRYAGMERGAIRASSHAMVIHELHFAKYDYWIWDAYGSPRPSRVLTLDGVPLVTVYERNKNAAGIGKRP